VLVIVEHLERCISPWLLSEYSYVVEIFGRDALFTNVRSRRAREILEDLGARVEERGVVELVRSGAILRPLVLDPKAPQELRPIDIYNFDAVIIGGIMGEHPPRGRTFREIVAKLPSNTVSRNLGRYQLTIAGAAYVLRKVAEGRELGQLDIRFGLRFTVKLGNYEVEIELPYAFPYEDGRPVLPRNYLEVISARSLLFEQGYRCLDKPEE
jgi:ribosome biogenesis SPOUT family RNA methylase Rps3